MFSLQVSKACQGQISYFISLKKKSQKQPKQFWFNKLRIEEKIASFA